MLSAVAAGLAAVSLTITTQNVRHTLPADQAHHDIAQAAQRSAVLVTQEMGGRRAARFAPAGWGTAHAGLGRRGDCATYWRRDTWHLLRSRTVALPLHRWALVTVLGHQGARLAVVCVHMPTRRERTWADYRHAIARLRTLAGHLRTGQPVVLAGDWNQAWGQRLLRDWRSARPPQVTLGHRRTDFAYWCAPLRRHSITTLGHTYSDHQAVRVQLRQP